MAYEQELSNFARQTDVVSAAMSEAFVAQSIGLGLVYSEAFPAGVNVVKFRKAGYGTAQTIAELGNFTYGSDTEITDSSVSATAAKKVFASKHSIESLQYGGPSASYERFGREHGGALSRLFDANLKTLFSGIATTVTASTTLTKDNILDARYNVVKSMKGAFSGNMVAVLDYKGANELSKELTSSTGTAFVQQVDLGVVGIPQSNGYAGSLLGVDIFQTDGLPTSSSDDVACVFDPMNAFAAGVDGVQSFNSELIFVGSQGGYFEMTSWGFWHIVEWNDTAACALLSDT